MKWERYFFGFLIAALAIAACDPEPKNTPISPPRAPLSPPPVSSEIDPAAYRGAAIAQQVCNQCHDIGLGQGPEVPVQAPAFRDIAKRPDTTPEKLAAWMARSHTVMPNYMFTEPDVSDLAAFIASLRAPSGDPLARP